MGPNPRFKRLTMLSTMIETEDLLKQYLNKSNGAYRPAPSEIGKTLGGPCGLFFALDGRGASSNNSEKQFGAASPLEQQQGGAGGVGEELSRITPMSNNNSDNEEEDSDEDEDYEDEEDIIAGLMQQISELESEKQSLTSLNTELQKKSVALLLREKSLQGQAAAARVATEGGAAADVQENTSEQNMEKEKQYHDTLHLIVEDRVKLNEQLKEFDQLALDLQTRLDDKELKFNGIDLSFKKFKK